MKRKFRPLGVGGLRLYEVILRYPGHPEWQERFVVVAGGQRRALVLEK